MTSFEKLEAAVKALDAKKGREIEAVRVDDLTVLADYFVIATATSSTHVRALADEVEDVLSRLGEEPDHIEGKTTGWILLDYHDVVVNVFDRKSRDFYQLERVWNDGEKMDLSGMLEPETQGEI
ncbi:MAG: ribosome silencing factor [Candidatus Howiella sp.]|jgi:ribosome-associated protein